MATFVMLASFTDQGIRNVKETISRAESFKQMAAMAGVRVKSIYWTLGRHDLVAICDVPEDEDATALSLRAITPRQTTHPYLMASRRLLNVIFSG